MIFTGSLRVYHHCTAAHIQAGNSQTQKDPEERPDVVVFTVHCNVGTFSGVTQPGSYYLSTQIQMIYRPLPSAPERRDHSRAGSSCPRHVTESLLQVPELP